jgi:hypothetical protein
MRAIQEKLPTPSPIVDDDREAPRGGDNELLELPVSMTSTERTCGDVIQVVHPPDRKGNVAISLNKGEIPPLIRDLREFNDADGPAPYFCACLRLRKLPGSAAYTNSSRVGIWGGLGPSHDGILFVVHRTVGFERFHICSLADESQRQPVISLTNPGGLEGVLI